MHHYFPSSFWEQYCIFAFSNYYNGKWKHKFERKTVYMYIRILDTRSITMRKNYETLSVDNEVIWIPPKHGRIHFTKLKKFTNFIAWLTIFCEWITLNALSYQVVCSHWVHPHPSPGIITRSDGRFLEHLHSSSLLSCSIVWNVDIPYLFITERSSEAKSCIHSWINSLKIT